MQNCVNQNEKRTERKLKPIYQESGATSAEEKTG